MELIQKCKLIYAPCEQPVRVATSSHLTTRSSYMGGLSSLLVSVIGSVCVAIDIFCGCVLLFKYVSL